MKNHQTPAVIAAIATIHRSIAYTSFQNNFPTAFCRRPNNNNIGSSSKCISHAQHPYRSAKQHRQQLIPLFSDPSSDNEDIEYDPNRWLSSDEQSALGDASWEGSLADREDGSLWSSFASSEDDDKNDDDDDSDKIIPDDDDQDIDDGELWLDTLASIAADEVEFNMKEADRADKVRQMQELGFSSDSISSTLGVAVDTEQEDDKSNEIFEAFKEETAKTGFGLMVDDEVDLQTVESHTQVEWDEEADEPVRAQHVYVDEVTCIGCTNCAMIAQSTFFMEGEHGRARVFQQWGDDDETIEVAIQTCPVDCIHYVPYDELQRLEIERRDQNINFKARLVSQGESSRSQAKYGGGSLYTEQQIISGNMGSRCNNCPSRGCKNCPMFGVGLNPEFQKKEEKRKEKIAKAEMKKKMESANKRAEL